MMVVVADFNADYPIASPSTDDENERKKARARKERVLRERAWKEQRRGRREREREWKEKGEEEGQKRKKKGRGRILARRMKSGNDWSCVLYIGSFQPVERFRLSSSAAWRLISTTRLFSFVFSRGCFTAIPLSPRQRQSRNLSWLLGEEGEERDG